MQKLAAILLGGLFLFNWVGYRALHQYWQDRATRRLQAKLDKAQYQPDQLLHLKAPATHLSYYNQSADFESIEGRIDIDGVPYQYVARRIANDSVEYLCIPNTVAKNLRSSQTAYFALVNDLQQTPKRTKGAHDPSPQNYLGDPYLLPEMHSFVQWDYPRLTSGYHYHLHIPTGVPSRNERPPAIFA